MPVRLGEEFLCAIYVGYLQNLLGRMRTMVLSMAGVFASIAIAVGSIPLRHVQRFRSRCCSFC